MSAPLVMHEKQAAMYVGVSRRKLRQWRYENRLPRLDLDDRYVWYRRADLERFIADLPTVEVAT